MVTYLKFSDEILTAYTPGLRLTCEYVTLWGFVNLVYDHHQLSSSLGFGYLLRVTSTPSFNLIVAFGESDLDMERWTMG